MDYVSSMLSFDQNTEDLFQSFSFSCSYLQQQEDELLAFALSEDSSCLPNPNKKSDHGNRRRKASSNNTFDVVVNDENHNNDRNKKRIIHRDLERQRRQEMATLYGTLRSLLPPDYLKGKRSLSDHMQQAVNYIKHLQSSISELTDNRDELKRLPLSTTSSVVPAECYPEGCSEVDSTVMVRPLLEGLSEIVVCSDLKEGIALSTILGVIVAEGLNVINSSSTKVHQKLLHTIVAEVSDGRSVYLRELEEKLAELKVRILHQG